MADRAKGYMTWNMKPESAALLEQDSVSIEFDSVAVNHAVGAPPGFIDGRSKP